MKRVRFMGIGLLMCSLLLTSCGQDVPQRSEEEPETEEATNWEEIFPFENFPTEGESQESAGNTGKVTPERIDNSIFRAKFEGTEVEGTGKAVDGVYRFNATKTDGESWHVKLECNYPTVAGRDYFVTYNFRSDVAGKVKFGDFQEFSIHKGDNSITGVMIASSGTSYLDLQLGMLSPFTIDFTSIEVKEYEDESKYENALPKPVNFERESVVYEKHDSGYAVIPVRREDTINVNFADAPDDPGVWKSRLYIRTGVIPELGSRYRVTADIMCHDDMPFEVLFNNGDEEKGYGALYEQSLKADEVKKIEAVVTGRGYGDELVMQLSLGKTPDGSKVIFGNVQVDKIIDNYTSMLPADFELDDSIWTGGYIEQMIPVAFKKLPLDLTYDGIDTIYEGHDDGYVVDLKESGSEATYKIKQAPSKADDRGVWKAKLYVATGVKLQPGQTYLVKYDLTPTGDQADYEVCFDGDSENAYGALYGRSLKAGQTDHVEQLITPESAGGPLTLRLQLGKTDSSKGNTYKLSNVSIESVTQTFTNVLPSDFSYETSAGKVTYKNVLPDDFAYTTGANVTEQHADGYTQSVSAENDSATLDITEAPSGNRDVWNSRLLINTGVTPEEGKKYIVSFDIKGEKAQESYEVCFDGNTENSYGAMYASDTPQMVAGETETIKYSFTPKNSDGPLVLRFQLGKTDDESGNKITVSNIQVAEVVGEEMTEVELTDFAYPLEGGTENNSFDLEANNETKAELTGDGLSATAKVIKPGDDWHVKLYVKPGLELKEGEQYTISMDVTGADGCTAAFKNTANGNEEGFGTATVTNGSVTHKVTAPETGTMEVVLKIGNVDAGTEVTVSNFKIEQSVLDYIPSEVSITYPTVTPGSSNDGSFFLETNSGAGAEMSGDGSKAVATITKSGADWNVKFYVKPELTLEKGESYKVSMNVSGADGCTAAFKNLSVDGEEGFGKATISSGKLTHTITPEVSGKMEVILKIGNLSDGSVVTVNNVKIEKQVDQDSDKTPGSIDYWLEPPGEGAAATQNNNSVTVNTSTNDDWRIKFYVQPRLSLEKGKTYKVSMNVSGADGCTAAFKNLSVDGEEGFGTATISSGKLTQTITPEVSGTMEVVLKIGKLPEESVVTVSNVKIIEVTKDYENVGLSGFTYPTVVPEKLEKGSFDLEANSGTEAKLSGDGSKAVATVTKPGDDWHVKFYVKPGIELEKGKKYKVNMTVSGADGCTAAFKNTATGKEDGFGTAPVTNGSVTHEISASETGTLEVLLKIGNVDANTEVTISSFEISEYKAGNKDVTPEDFEYPVTTESSQNSFDLEANNGAEAELTGDGKSTATATVTKPGDDWHVKFYVNPEIELEEGKTYKISMDVSGADGCIAAFKNRNGEGEEGFGKEEIKDGALVHTVTAEETGILEVLLKIGNVDANTAVTITNFKIEEGTELAGENLMTDPLIAWAPVHAFMDAGYSGDLTNDDSSATMKLDTVPSDPADWKVKLFVETGAELKAGKKYRISYKLNADKATNYNVFYNNGAEEKAVGEFYDLNTGTTTVEHTVTPGNDAVLNIQLMVGKSAAENNLTISDVKVEEVIEENPKTPINVWVHEDYKASLSNTNSSASLAITKVPSSGREAWKIKLFAETGAKLEKGKTYRVSVDVQSKSPMDYEICYNNVEVEKELGAQYGLKATSSKKTVTYNITPEKDAELILQFGLGNASKANTFTISNVKVEESSISSSTDCIPDFSYDSVGYISKAADGDFITSLDQKDSSAVFKIKKAPSDRHPWEAKVIVRTGVTPKSGKGYRVSVDIDSARSQNMFEVFYDGNEELAYGALYEQYLPAGKKTFSYIIYPGDSKGEISMQLRFGQTNSTSGNVYKISNVKVEEVTFKHTRTPEIKNVSELDTQPGYTSTLERTPFKDTIRLIKTPKEGLEAWKTKLFINTGVTLQEGQKYRIRMLVRSIIPAPFEVCLNNKDVEKGLGGIFGLMSKPYGEYVEYSAYVKEDIKLVIQLSLGNCVAPNTIMVSDVQVEKAGKINLISDKIYVF
ncbi:MAG: hypothetical protein IKG15_02905 [Solobacterium sp.]|nr:hypothetical protein [Solobacterium sp.]